MSTLSEFEEIFRRLPADVQDLIRMLRAGAHRLTPGELIRLIAAIILAGGPRAAIERILVLMARLGWISGEVLAGALAEAEALAAANAAGGTAVAGGTAGGTAAGGTAAGGTAAGGTAAGGTAGGAGGTATGAGTTTAGGGAGAVAINVAVVAAIAVLAIEIVSLINAISALSEKGKLQVMLARLNTVVMQGIGRLRAARAAGRMTEAEFQQQLQQVIDAFIRAQVQIDAANNALQDELDDNILINIGEWFYGETNTKTQHLEVPVTTSRLVAADPLTLGQVTERFATLLQQPDCALAPQELAELRRATAPAAVRPAFAFFQEQWQEQSYPDAYRQVCLRAARYYGAPVNEAALEFWQGVHAGAPSDAFARKQAVIACFGCDHPMAWEFVLRIAREDRDPLVRVFAWEVLGSIASKDGARRKPLLAHAAAAARSGDNAARLGAVYALSLALPATGPQGAIDAGVTILKQLVASEKNRPIAGAALAVLTRFVSESEIGAFLPATAAPEPAAPGKADMLVSVVNRMASAGDAVRLARLVGQPSFDKERAAKLFASAPFSSAEEIGLVDDVGRSMLDAMIASLHENLARAEVDARLLPTLPVLRAAADKLARSSPVPVLAVVGGEDVAECARVAG
ncbi:MAG: hypothetical protein K0S57_2772 [Ramlibacter sp.]|jgi:hypothetical protein|nr:hypothetical protein [Ramlibacter sp.]